MVRYHDSLVKREKVLNILHLAKRHWLAFLSTAILLVVMGLSLNLVWQSYCLRGDMAGSTTQGTETVSGLNTELPGLWLSDKNIQDLKEIVRTSALLITALFALSALLLWYAIHSRTLLARAASIRKKSHDRYRFLTEGPPTIGIVRFSLVDFRLLDCNRAALNITGMPRAEFIGRPVTDFIDARDTGFVNLELEELRAGRSSHYFIVKMPQYHGGVRHIAWHISVIRQLDEEPQAVAILTDISREHEVQIERMEKERLAGVLQMAGAAAHELNQPMQVVSGLLWMLLNKIDKRDPSYKTLRTIYAEVERMTAISRKISAIGSYEVKEYVGETKIIDIDRAAGGRGR